jgi:hypothetical protein
MDRAYPERNWQEQYTKFGSYEHEIARGNVRGAYPVSTYGKLVAGSAVTNIMVQGQDGTVLRVPHSIQMSVVSTSANDTANGTGVRTVVIEYLNGNLDASIEILSLNGTTPVLTQATDIRWIQAIYAATMGSGGAAAGVISVTNNGNTYEQIAVGERASHSSFERVPRGKRMYITGLYAGASSGTAATSVLAELVTTQIDGLDQQETGLFYKTAGIALQDSSTTLALPLPLPVYAGQIVGFVATCDKGATITAGLIGWLEDAS